MEYELELLELGAPAYIGAVRLNGVDVDLETVLASVTVRHGADSVGGGIQSSTATLRLRGLARGHRPACTGLADWEVGGELEVADLDGELLFTGRLTDADLADDDPAVAAILTVIATSTLARSGGREVGGQQWPAESWAARVARILAEAGLDGVVQAPTRDADLAATVVDDPEAGTFASVAALDALAATADDVGAVIFDDPAGRIVVQAYEGRAGLYPRLLLDPDVVLFSPPWSQKLDVANRIVLGYGYGAGTVTVDDPASQDVFGVHWTGLFTTGLADQATALDRATAWLARLAYPRWSLPGVTLLEPAPLHVGQLVQLVDLPASAPYPEWSAVVEGWTDSIEGASWTQELVLSDPVLSGLAFPWSDIPPTVLWSTVDPACAWKDAFTLDNLDPALGGRHA